MIVTGTMWANKMEKKAKGGTHAFDNIAPFQLCWVQLGIRSIMAKASENGMILEIKSITAASSQYSLSSCALVPHDAVTHSIQASVDFRNKFLDGEFVSEAKRKHLKQARTLLRLGVIISDLGLRLKSRVRKRFRCLGVIAWVVDSGRSFSRGTALRRCTLWR